MHPAQLQQPLLKKSLIFDWVRSDIDDADADPDDDDGADADAAPAPDDADARANRFRKLRRGWQQRVWYLGSLPFVL